MRSCEHRDTEPAPRWCTVDVVALRPNPERVAAEWRRTLPALLAGIVGEVAAAELEFRMLTDDDGMVSVELAVTAGDDTAAVAAELAAALDQVAETAVRTETPTNHAEWPLIADSRADRLGFVAGPADTPAKSMPWQRTGDASESLIEELAGMPGHGVRIRLHTIARGTEPRWEARLSVVTTGGAPSLRARANIRRRFAGLQVAAAQHDSTVPLQLGAADLAAVFDFPVAGAEPLAGAYLASPAPIPATPPRPGFDDGHPGLRIGHAFTGGGRPFAVQLTETERLRHVHVLGRTGTGKSSALAGIVRGLAERGEGALVADPHGHLCDRILAELPDEARQRVWVIRCGDVDNPVPLNPLAEADPVRRDIAIAEVCATFQYLFDKKETGIVGPRFHERVGMTLRALAAVHGTRASLLDVPFASTDENFMDVAVAHSDDDRLKTWWRNNKLEKRSDEHGQVIAWVNSKFGSFSNTAAMRAILGSGANAIDFAQAMDDGRIILLDLSKANLGESASRLLGYLYLGRVWDAALRRTRTDRPFTVIVDEAHTLIAGALTNMLAEGRKFGLSVMLAHQYLEQLDADLRPAVDGNVATTIAFRSAVGDAVELHRRFGGLVDTSVLVTLPDLTAVCLRTAMAGPAHPHTLVIDHNERVVGRRGVEHLAKVREVLSWTHDRLVDPYRDITAAAGSGVSNLKALPIEAIKDACPSPSPPSRKSSAPQIVLPSQHGRSMSFLDEWLTKRKKLAVEPTNLDLGVPGAGAATDSGGAGELSLPLGDDIEDYNSIGA